MRITPSEIEEMDAQAIAALARETRDYPHAPRPPRHRSSPTTGSNSYLSSTYMDNTDIRTLSSWPSISAPPDSSSHYHFRHRQPSNNHHTSFPRLLPTPIRPTRTFTHDLAPIYRDDSLFSLPGIDSGDPYLRDSAGKLHMTSAPGTYEEVHPMQLPLAYVRPWDGHVPDERTGRGFLYDRRYEYNDFARWDEVKENRSVEGEYRWSNPSYEEMYGDAGGEDEGERREGWDELAGEEEMRGYRRDEGRRGESPLRRRRGNERLSTMFVDDAANGREDTERRGGETVIEVKTAGGTVVKVKKARRREER